MKDRKLVFLIKTYVIFMHANRQENQFITCLKHETSQGKDSGNHLILIAFRSIFPLTNLNLQCQENSQCLHKQMDIN